MADQVEVQYIEDTDSATEYQLKHTPSVKVEGHPDSLVLRVSIGLDGISHPQTEEHYIEWIAVYVGDAELDRVVFRPTQTPQATFDLAYPDQPFEVRAACNLHGVFGAWAT
jgi:superoxide reductase